MLTAREKRSAKKRLRSGVKPSICELDQVRHIHTKVPRSHLKDPVYVVPMDETRGDPLMTSTPPENAARGRTARETPISTRR